MEFVCPDPNALVRAANVKATLDAFSFEPTFGQRITQRHKLALHKMRPDSFLPVQRWLDALQEIQGKIGPATVRKVGSAIIERADFPPSLGTAEKILEALDDIYHLNHRGEVGHYRVAHEDGAVVVRCETPYPRAFERGLIEGICHNPRTGGRAFNIDYAEAPPGGDLTCTIRVRFSSTSSPA
jgi:hypothetical protein